MQSLPAPSFSVERLEDSHNRAHFSSGVPDLDKYLQTQAGQDQKRLVAATFVLLDELKTLAGYYTLSAYGARLVDLPPEIAKKLPKYPTLPATLLGRLAIHQDRHGKGLGQFLLMDALHRCLRNTQEIGSIGVVVDAYDDVAASFYKHHEFIGMPGHDWKLFLPMSTVKKLFRP